jgi:hypothetical protein
VSNAIFGYLDQALTGAVRWRRAFDARARRERILMLCAALAVAYLRALESMPHRVLWGSLELHVEHHPKVVMSLRLYTLSDDDSWLEI